MSWFSAVIAAENRNKSSCPTQTWCRSGCSKSFSVAGSSGSFTATTPVTRKMSFPFPQPDSCDVTAGAGLLDGSGHIHVSIASTLPPPPAHPIRGLGGKCADDPANKSANGTRIEIWSCNKTAAQNWAFSDGQRRVRAQGARRHAVPHRPGFFDEETRNGTKLVVFRCK